MLFRSIRAIHYMIKNESSRAFNAVIYNNGFSDSDAEKRIKMDLLKLREQIDAIDEQIVDLYEKRMDISRQVAEFKIETGKKVFDKVREDEKLRKVTEYNNSVREKQAKLDADRLKTENDLYLDAIKLQKQATSVDNLSAEERNAVYSAVFDKMDEYLSGMSAEQARLELRNHTLYRDHLSDYYFYKLYDKYGR